MKTVYINESMMGLLKESVLADSLPSNITNAISTHDISIGNNPAIPDIFDVPFIYKLVNASFKNAKESLEEIGEISDVKETTIEGVLARLLNRCQKEERPYRSELEKLCMNYIIDAFKIPEDTVEITMELKDEIDLEKESIRLDPIDGDGNDELELNDVNDAMSIRDEVYKRRILDAICMGAGMELSKNFASYEEDINSINPKLMDLYKKIIALNTYLLYVNGEENLTDKNKMQIGTVEVSLGKEDEKVKIEAQGTIFPILLSESFRGFMELFASHGLPKDRMRASAVIGKSDYLKAEPWDMRIGPGLWELLSKSFNDITLEDIPYLFKRISCLETQKFNFLMKEVFAKTKKGKEIMSYLCNKSKEDAEYDKFADKMDKMKKDKGVITDEFIHESELKGTEKKQTAYVMVGIPGSGKSTWIKNNLGDIDVVSRDIIRGELGFTSGADEKFVGTKEQEREVTRVERKRIGDLCDSKKDFVIDDTNTGRFRKELIDFLRNKGVKITFVRLNTDLETCIKRREGQIPSDVMRRLHSNLVEPQDGEYDDIINV